MSIKKIPNEYGVADVEKLLGITRSTIRVLIAAGYVAPVRGARGTLRFSFQDLILLRTAQALSAANISNRRIAKSLRELRKQLPESMPLSGLRITAEADRVVVREGKARWQAGSGQYLLAFDGQPEAGKLAVIERQPPQRGDEDWFERALQLESENVDAAIEAYERAIEAEPDRIEAALNLGRLLHERGRLAQAQRVYREAIKLRGDDALLWFNLAVLLEDRGRRADAISAYNAALRRDPQMADAHYNLSLLHDHAGRKREALRHMAQYRRLLK